MIRNVVAGRLRSSGDPAQQAADVALLQEGLAGIAKICQDIARVQFRIGS